MIFIVFSVVLWLIALFHIWDHRRFERDLARQMDMTTAAGKADWRPVALPRGVTGGRAFRRAFMIHTREDAARYAVPVLFFMVLLLLVKTWLWAGLYLAAVAVKWFALTTVLDAQSRRYAIYLLHRRLFTAPLP